MKNIYLVGCGKKKADGVCEAQDLYTGELFRSCRKYIETIDPAAEWYILSARYGLLNPVALVEPYDASLNNQTVSKRKRWAHEVMRVFWSAVKPGDRVVFLAGKQYREFLIPAIVRLGAAVEIPLAGLGIGQQIQFLKRVIKQEEGSK